MRVFATGQDNHPVEGHPERFHDHGVTHEGQRLVVDRDFIAIDGEVLFTRTGTLPGHPWHSAEDMRDYTDVWVASEEGEYEKDHAPDRIIGYTAFECERDMRRLTDGERGCANPEEHTS